MKKTILLTFLILNSLLYICKAQTGVTQYPSPFTSALTTGIAIDGSNNKWVSCYKGLIKFDGTTFTKYNPSNSGMPDSMVYCVAVDAANNVWCGSRAGLTKFDGTTWTTFNISNSGIPNDTVNCILPQGTNIWVGTKNGVGRLVGTSWNVYNSSNSGLTTRIVNCLALDQVNDLYVGTKVGLYRKSGSVWTDYATVSAYYTQHFDVKSVYVDASNTKWIGTISNIYHVFGNSFTPIAKYFQQYTYYLNNPNGYSIVKGPMGGMMFTANVPPANGLIEIVGGQLYFYSGLNFGAHFTNSYSGLIWGVANYSTSVYSFNYLNYTLTTPLKNPMNITVSAYLDVNEVSALIHNLGDMFWDIYGTQNAAYEVPKGKNKSAKFAAALWMGGIDNGGTLHSAAQTYRQSGNDYWPGPIDTITGTTDSLLAQPYNRLWKLDRLKIEEFLSQYSLGNVTSGLYAVDSNIITYPAIGTGNFMHNLSPYQDVNNDGLYRPLINGDYPIIKGDQEIYLIFNDAVYPHTESGCEPLQVEIHATAYAYTCPVITDSLDVLNYTTFYNYKIYNRSTNNYHNTHIGYWDDMDLGWYHDDHTGCNPSMNYGMSYNGTNVDGTGQFSAYGQKPPMNSSVILNGPTAEPNDSIDNNNNGVVDEVGEKNLMTNYLCYNNDPSPGVGNPQFCNDYIRYMSGYWKDSTHLTYGGSGYGGTIPTNFMFDGALDDTVSGWTEYASGNIPDDRRFLMGCGPFNLDAGQMVEFDMAQVFTRDTISTYTIGNLYQKNRDDVRRVQQWFAVDSFPSCYSLFAGVNELGVRNEELEIYPNPSSGLFQISSSSKIQSVKITNILGEMVYQSAIRNSQSAMSIDLSGVSKGIYFVEVIDENKKAINKKITVQ